MTRILYDTDLIGDDLLTIIAAAGLKDVRVEGITGFGRRIPAVERAEIAALLCHALGLRGVPTAGGADRPLLNPPRKGCEACDGPITSFRQRMRERAGREASGDILPDPRGAVPLIVETIRNNPGEITLLGTGPFTNLAQAVLQAPDIAEKVKEVVIMGGTAWTPGNTSVVSESNVFTDPHAAAVLFERFPAVTMVGLDVTLKTLVDESVLASLEMKDGGSARRLVLEMVQGIIRACCEVQLARRGTRAMPLHDPLSLLVAWDPSLVKLLPCDIRVELSGTHTCGMTVCTALSRSEAGARSHRVAVEVDSRRAVDTFVSCLKNVFDAVD
ncbi:MAG: nucleoside hydrolase [Spirochaetales bacterium]|nr:nucleoside hydrolase [Spirochaetales bacterium]